MDLRHENQPNDLHSMELQQLNDDFKKLRVENETLKQLESTMIETVGKLTQEHQQVVDNLKARIKNVELELEESRQASHKLFVNLTDEIGRKSIGDGDSNGSENDKKIIEILQEKVVSFKVKMIKSLQSTRPK